MEKYNPQIIEKKWQEKWRQQNELSEAQENSDKPKFYCLDMFPYPSAAGLHVGHVENYTATDIYSRFKRLNGFNVLHPIGWDAFGLPAENFAIKSGTHPDVTTHNNIKNFTKQIQSLGMSYDWSREIDTSSPEYYKWTQWFFLFLYKNGLAYKKKGKVNWCDSCKTVLANEQVIDGACERCKNQVVQKDLEQWFFKITDFIEDQKNQDGKIIKGLISGLDDIDWPNSTKLAQKNWIGKSEGAEFDFQVVGSEQKVRVFTTRIDTVFGVTYVVLAPEHSLVQEMKTQIANFKEVENYLEQTKKKSDLERMEAKEKTGVELEGVKVKNPFNGEEVPLFVADYVLSQYGTGAVMAVPAHDERDYEFAIAKKLSIRYVIIPSRAGSYQKPSNDMNWQTYETVDGLKSQILLDTNNEVIRSILTSLKISKKANVDDGLLVDSQEYSLMTSDEAREKMVAWLEKEGIGQRRINYRLRDWLVSRQRYWGAPIPIIYCEDCGEVAVPEKDLPVLLPTDVDFQPKGDSPLALSKTFHDVVCPKCGKKARRESDTMDTFVCSSWYYLRFADPKNTEEFASKTNIEKWMPVDLYMGGAEHTVLHLLYARFFTKALAKHGYVNFDEPFLKLRHQGMIMAEDGRKMSKSLGNVVNPDDVVAEFGADALRLYEMFMGPLEEMKAWNMKNIVGLSRFLEKVCKLRERIKIETDDKILGAGIFVEVGRGMYLFQERDGFAEVAPEKITFWGGGREKEESLIECAIRELLEELGLKINADELGVLKDMKADKYVNGGVDRFFSVYAKKKFKVKEGKGSVILSLNEAINHPNIEERTRLILEQIKSSNNIKSLIHKTIKKVTDDIENFRFNTAISSLMILVNEMDKQKELLVTDFELLVTLLAPFAPHLAEELWETLGHKESIFLQKWPEFNPELAKDEEIEMVVQVNGKVRERLMVAADVTEDEIKETALENPKVKVFTDGKEIKKIIFVPGKLINIVTA